MAARDIRELDARAVRATVAVVGRISRGDLDRSTPCATWNLGELLAHMTTQHDGFAAAAAGGGADPAAWESHSADDPVSAYADAAERVIAAFAENGVIDRKFALPEISTDVEFPAAQAISFHFVDYVVHGWDVARALGVPYDLDPDLLAPALEIALAVPGGERRLQPGAAFAPGRDASADAGPLDRIVSTLGRSATWPDAG